MLISFVRIHRFRQAKIIKASPSFISSSPLSLSTLLERCLEPARLLLIQISQEAPHIAGFVRLLLSEDQAAAKALDHLEVWLDYFLDYIPLLDLDQL